MTCTRDDVWKHLGKGETLAELRTDMIDVITLALMSIGQSFRIYLLCGRVIMSRRPNT